MLHKLERFLPYILFLVALGVFFAAYIPSSEIIFRVEQWTLYSYYRGISLDSLENLTRVMFWTPFNDYRLIPGAYLWHYTTFFLFETNSFAYWCVSISLHFLNAFLVYLLIKAWTPQFYESRGAIVGASLFLVLPSCYELVIWSLFGYKLLHITIMLSALLMFQCFLRTGSYLTGFLCTLLLFFGHFFYETSLFLAAGLLSGFFLLNHNLDKKRILYFCLLTVISIATYLFLFEFLKQPVIKILNMEDHSGIINYFSIADGFLGTFFWLFTLIKNSSGIPLAIDVLPNHIYTVSKNIPLFVSLLLGGIWTAIVISFTLYRERTEKREGRILFIFVLLLFSISPIVAVRLTAEGLPYLLHMAIYAYFPLLLFSAMLGVFATRFFASNAKKEIKISALVLFLVIILFEGASAQSVIAEYMKVEKPLIELTKLLREKISQEPTKKFYVDHYLPASPPPEPFIPSEATTFSAYHLLFPNNIVPDRCFADEIITPKQILLESSIMGSNLISRPLSQGAQNARLEGVMKMIDTSGEGEIIIHLNTVSTGMVVKISTSKLTVFTQEHQELMQTSINLFETSFPLKMEITDGSGSLRIHEKQYTFPLPYTKADEGKYSVLVSSPKKEQKMSIQIENFAVTNSCEGFQMP